MLTLFLTRKPPKIVLPFAGASYCTGHIFFGLLSVFTSSNPGYLKNLNVGLSVFLSNCASLLGPGSSAVLSVLSEAVRKSSEVWALGSEPPSWSLSVAPRPVMKI